MQAFANGDVFSGGAGASTSAMARDLPQAPYPAMRAHSITWRIRGGVLFSNDCESGCPLCIVGPPKYIGQDFVCRLCAAQRMGRVPVERWRRLRGGLGRRPQARQGHLPVAEVRWPLPRRSGCAAAAPSLTRGAAPQRRGVCRGLGERPHARQGDFHQQGRRILRRQLAGRPEARPGCAALLHRAAGRAPLGCRARGPPPPPPQCLQGKRSSQTATRTRGYGRWAKLPAQASTRRAPAQTAFAQRAAAAARRVRGRGRGGGG